MDNSLRENPAVPLPRLSYDIAYKILPDYAYRDLEKVADLCLNMPALAGAFFYYMAAFDRNVEPDAEVGMRYRWHHGRWSEGGEYFLLEYPTPPPVDMSDVTIEELLGGRTKAILAPYFSVIVRSGGKVGYFILGQAPIGGETTLRFVDPMGTNCNLGPGPLPELSSFLEVIRERTER